MINHGFNYEVGEDQIAVITMDMPGQSVNTMNDAYCEYMDNALRALKKDIKSLKGVIITSGKKTFFAGGDIHRIKEDKQQRAWDTAFDFNLRLKRQLMDLENIGVPVVAAINGAAMGGGLEICLSCHYRVAINSPGVKVGLPEVGLGLLPAAGGIVRSVRLLGLKRAFPLLVEGKRYTAPEALELGLINELADDAELMIAKAKAWIDSIPEAIQPWLRKGYKIPGGDAYTPANAAMLAAAPAMLRRKTQGLLPAPEAILSAMAEGSMTGYEAAMNIESRYFSNLLRSPESTSLIETMYVQMNEISGGASRPKGVEKKRIKKVGVLGAGMMGRGIAYATASTGTPVCIKDITLENAEKGREHARLLLDKQVNRGRITRVQMEDIMSMIEVTDKNEDLSECDIVIEAVFEDLELKQKVIQEVEPFLKKECIWGSNTSTLPISLLSESFSHPERFIGTHFFSPVEKMKLVEIICGDQGSTETLAFAYDFVTQIAKTPIVVNDGRGFYTSRVFGCFCDEGLYMLTEGVNPAVIENTAKHAGMPVGPLSVLDEVEIELMRKVGVTNLDLDERLGDNFHATHEKLQDVAIEMCSIGRSGRSVGKGFYDYHPDGTKSLWIGLGEKFGEANTIPLEDVRDRLMFRQVIETLNCISRGVVLAERDANIGSILGWGFPIHTGGTFGFIEWFGGADKFTERANELEQAYGERFRLPMTIEKIKEKCEISG